jgi:hypothetical protein
LNPLTVEGIFNKDDKEVLLNNIADIPGVAPWQPEPNKVYQIDIKLKYPVKVYKIALVPNSNVEHYVIKISDYDGNIFRYEVLNDANFK